MTLKLTYLGATALARHFRHANQFCQWVPRSVTTAPSYALKAGEVAEVQIADWWLKENPFAKPVPKGQQSLL